MVSPIDALRAYVPSLVLDRLGAGPIGAGRARADPVRGGGPAHRHLRLHEPDRAAGRAGGEGFGGAFGRPQRLLRSPDRADRGPRRRRGEDGRRRLDRALAGPPRGSRLASATLRAAAAGSLVQETLQDYEVAEGIRLSSKVGIGVGEVAALFVGGEQERWELLLAGSPLVQMGQAEHQARPGDVVLSNEAWSLVREGSVGEPLEEGCRPAPPGSCDRPQADARRPGPAPSGVDRSGRSSPPRSATGSTPDRPPGSRSFDGSPSSSSTCRPDRRRSARRPRPGHARSSGPSSRALYQHEGSLNKLSVDEKGTMVVAAMGLPPLAHRDDARRGRAGRPGDPPGARRAAGSSARWGSRRVGSIAARSAMPAAASTRSSAAWSTWPPG